MLVVFLYMGQWRIGYYILIALNQKNICGSNIMTSNQIKLQENIFMIKSFDVYVTQPSIENWRVLASIKAVTSTRTVWT